MIDLYYWQHSDRARLEINLLERRVAMLSAACEMVVRAVAISGKAILKAQERRKPGNKSCSSAIGSLEAMVASREIGDDF
jgi:hypothetical protein